MTKACLVSTVNIRFQSRYPTRKELKEINLRVVVQPSVTLQLKLLLMS